MISVDSRLRIFLTYFIFCSLGCVTCFYLQKAFSIPSFIASILVGLVGSFLPSSRHYDFKKGTAAIYTGSFAAMCSLSYFTQAFDIFVLSSFVGIYFYLLSPYLRGMGGKLGTIGFISSLSFVLIKAVL